MGNDYLDVGKEVVAEVIPGGGLIIGAIEKIGEWIGIKGKTPTIGWDQAQKAFLPYFDSVHKAFFSDNYSYELADIDDGLPLASKQRGIWVVGMFLKDKKTGQGTGLVLWARYGTIENRIGNCGTNADATGASRDIGKGLLGAEELLAAFTSKNLKLNSKVSDVKTGTGEIEEEEKKKKAGFPVDVNINSETVAQLAPYLVVGVVIVALVIMFKKS